MKINKDFIYISILFVIMSVFFVIFKDNIYSVYSDFGREVYIPTEMAKNNILYKDIFCIYSPLGYLLNTIIIKLLGNSLFTFQNIGFCLSMLIISSIYLITVSYTNKLTAFSTAAVLIPVCIYFPSSSNWITPYSYSILYALCGVLFSLLFIIKYSDTKKDIYLYISCLLYGFSLSSKYEYALFLIVIITVIIKNKTNIKTIIKSALLSLIIPLITISVLLLQNCSISDMLQAFNYSINLSKTESVNFFFSMIGIYPSKEILLSTLRYSVEPHFITFFVEIGIINIFLLIISIIKKYEFKYIILFLCAILISAKCIFAVSLNIYGTYFLPILFTAFIIFVYNLTEKNSKIIIAFLMIIFASYTYYCFKESNYLPINTQQGEIKVSALFYTETKELTEYITSLNTDKILILPEGALINYLTNTETDNKIFYLIPPNVELFGNEAINKHILSKQYKYIIVSNIMYPWFGNTSFINGWGENIMKTIKENYDTDKIIGNNLIFQIYKLKDKQ